MILPHSCIKENTENKRCPLEKSIAEKKKKSVVNYLPGIRSVSLLAIKL